VIAGKISEGVGEIFEDRTPARVHFAVVEAKSLAVPVLRGMVRPLVLAERRCVPVWIRHAARRKHETDR
jgi:hypothetical protein